MCEFSGIAYLKILVPEFFKYQGMYCWKTSRL